MNLQNSIDFLLENAGPVIRYRLRRDILRDLTPSDGERLLGEIYALPHFKLVESYVKPNGYIGSGAHSWGRWGGRVLHETPLQDGECAAILLSNYGVPSDHPTVRNFVSAMRDEETLRREFSYIPPEIPRFENRNTGLTSGSISSDVMVAIFAMQALLGYGDDAEVDGFREISYEAFRSMLDVDALSDIAKARPKHGYLYVESDTYLPCAYHLTTLAHTAKWRTPERITVLADAINRLNAVMRDDNCVSVKVGSKYYGPGWAFTRPIKPFTADCINTVMYRKVLTELAKTGVGERVGIIKESVENLKNAIGADGVLRLPELAKRIKKYVEYPTAYVDTRLEPDYKRNRAAECDATFWAVEFLDAVERRN